MATATIDNVRQALRITSTALDVEIQGLIDGAIQDLGIAGVEALETDPLMQRAIITYCKANFGEAPNYDRLKASYDEQKAQLKTADGYTDWGDDDEDE